MSSILPALCLILGRGTRFPLAKSLSSTRSVSIGTPIPLFAASPVLWTCPTSQDRTSWPCSLGICHADPGCQAKANLGISRFPHSVLLYMHRVFDSVRPLHLLPMRFTACCLPIAIRRSAPETLSLISELHTGPAHTPVNASAAVLPPPPHDSGPTWLARPSSWDSFIPCILSTLIGAFNGTDLRAK